MYHLSFDSFSSLAPTTFQSSQSTKEEEAEHPTPSANKTWAAVAQPRILAETLECADWKQPNAARPLKELPAAREKNCR